LSYYKAAKHRIHIPVCVLGGADPVTFLYVTGCSFLSVLLTGLCLVSGEEKRHVVGGGGDGSSGGDAGGGGDPVSGLADLIGSMNGPSNVKDVCNKYSTFAKGLAHSIMSGCLAEH